MTVEQNGAVTRTMSANNVIPEVIEKEVDNSAKKALSWNSRDEPKVVIIEERKILIMPVKKKMENVDEIKELS